MPMDGRGFGHSEEAGVVGRFLEASNRGTLVGDIPTLYAPDVVSVHGPADGGTVRGIAALTERMEARQRSIGGDRLHADGPYFLAGSGSNLRFAILFEREWSGPEDGPIQRMSQLAVFEVEDDLIVREEVFLQAAPDAGGAGS
jgi:hypothetical protein